MFCNILVPMDGSEMAAKILPQVEDLAKTCKAQKITFITAGVAPANEDLSYSGLDKFSAAIRADAEKNLSEYVAGMKAEGLNADSVYIEGEPAQTIISYAAENGYDLIAMATHGRGEMAWVIGSVAERVVTHAPMPVLLTRVMDIGALSKKDYFAMDTGDVLA
jgi:nucleotide-binding universal stress UspA family protein